MLVACQNCGAPLDVPDGKMFVPCSYCNQTTKVRSSRTLMQETPKNWAPPPTWTPNQPAWEPPPIQPAAPVVTSQGNPGARLLILGLVIPSTLAAVLLPLYLQGAFSAIPGFGLDLEGVPEIREVDFDREAVPPDLVGESSTMVDLSTIGGPGCVGRVGRRASVVLRTSVPRRVRLSVDATYDAVMALRTADGVLHCDDDSNGNLDPRVDALLAPGTHRVWVGALGQDGGPFTLHIVSEQAAGAEGTGLALEGAPSLATLVATAGATPFAQYEGTVFATVPGSEAAPNCRGYLSAAPQIAVQLESPTSVRFATRSASGQDLVMMLRDPNGEIVCDDDGAGSLQPQIDRVLPAGTTRVWVGTFSSVSGDQSRFELLVGAPGGTSGTVIQGAPSGQPTLGTVNLERLPRNTRYEGTTTGTNPASTWSPSCRGYIGSRPDLVIESRTPRDVELTTRARGDLVLLIRGPDGTVTCDDDSGREGNPLVHQRWEPGTHEVFVGSYAQNASIFYTLVLDERRAPSMRAADRGDK